MSYGTTSRELTIDGTAATVLHPQQAVPGLPPVIYCHGAGDTNPLEMTSWPSRRIVRALARLGFSCVSIVTTHTWGNAAGRAKNAAAAQYLRDNRGAVGDPVVIGASEGHTDGVALGLNEGIRCLVGIIPVTDLDDIRDNNISGFRSAIDTAHGVTWSSPGVQALPAGVNPQDSTAAVIAAGFPSQLWVAPVDTTASTAQANAYAAAIGADLHDLGGGLGHTETAMAAVDTAAMVAFVLDNL